jgi:hypothetical protein
MLFDPSLERRIITMAIAIGVAKVSGAVRCKGRGKDFEGEPLSVLKRPADFTISELVGETLAYVDREQKKISRETRAKKGGR